jgi:hypothetical protein
MAAGEDAAWLSTFFAICYCQGSLFYRDVCHAEVPFILASNKLPSDLDRAKKIQKWQKNKMAAVYAACLSTFCDMSFKVINFYHANYYAEALHYGREKIPPS